MRYPPERREAILAKPQAPYNRTVNDVAAEEGGTVYAGLCRPAHLHMHPQGSALDGHRSPMMYLAPLQGVGAVTTGTNAGAPPAPTHRRPVRH